MARKPFTWELMGDLESTTFKVEALWDAESPDEAIRSACEGLRGVIARIVTRLSAKEPVPANFCLGCDMPPADPPTRVPFAWRWALHGKIVDLHCTHIDESLRGRGNLGEHDGLTIRSAHGPLIDTHDIWIWGDRPDLDYSAVATVLPTHAEAIAFRDRAQAALEHVREEISARWEAEAVPDATCGNCAHWNGDAGVANVLGPCAVQRRHCCQPAYVCEYWVARVATEPDVDAAPQRDYAAEAEDLSAEQEIEVAEIQIFKRRWSAIVDVRVRLGRWDSGWVICIGDIPGARVYSLGDWNADKAEAVMREWFETKCVPPLSFGDMLKIWKGRRPRGASNPSCTLSDGTQAQAAIYIDGHERCLCRSNISLLDAFHKAHIQACYALADMQMAAASAKMAKGELS